MLKIVGGIAIILVVAFFGYRRTFTRLPLGARLVFLTGTEYIFVGYALGGRMIGLLDVETVRSLDPLFSLGLGLIGLILGIQLEVPKLRRFPASWLRMTLVEAVFTMLLVFWPFHFALTHLHGSGPEVSLACFVLAATAACTAQSALALIGREYSLRGTRVLDLLRYVSSLDGSIGLLLFGIAFALLRVPAEVGPELVVGVHRVALSLGIGGTMGVLLHSLTRVRCSDEELFLFVGGTVLFSAGLASYLRLSPLFVGLVVGAVATNLPGSKARILNLLARLEKPVYVVFLVLAGAILVPGSTWALPFAALYVATRLAGKLLGGWLAARSKRTGTTPPRTLGLGLVSQGGVAIAMVMSYYHASDADVAAAAVTAVLIAVICSELVGPSMARVVLRRAGEIEP